MSAGHTILSSFIISRLSIETACRSLRRFFGVVSAHHHSPSDYMRLPLSARRGEPMLDFIRFYHLQPSDLGYIFRAAFRTKC